MHIILSVYICVCMLPWIHGCYGYIVAMDTLLHHPVSSIGRYLLVVVMIPVGFSSVMMVLMVGLTVLVCYTFLKRRSRLSNRYVCMYVCIYVCACVCMCVPAP